jgi:hypothetical protein
MRLLLVLILFSQSYLISAQCTKSYRPVIFIHGFLASGDTWSNAVYYFKKAGYCENYLVAFDWNSVGGNARRTDSLLNIVIEQTLASTGASQVDLVGHSAGGGVARNYLRDSTRAKNIAHYVQIGSRKWPSEYAWFPNSKCLNIYSEGDKVAGTNGGPVEGAQNLKLIEEDHYQVATSEKSLARMLNFFQEKNSSKPDASTKRKIKLAGRAVTLGDNQPMSGASINIYSLDKSTGDRKSTSGKINTDKNGNWGPIIVSKETPYEFELIGADSTQRTISYFFPSFTHADPLVYLRGFPKGNMISALLSQIPKKEDQSVLVVYSATQAMISGRDSVSVNGVSICTPELTPASKTAITSFIYEDGDKVSSGQSIKQFNATPFIAGIDLNLLAGQNQLLKIYFNGQSLTIPAKPSKERVLLAVFR